MRESEIDEKKLTFSLRFKNFLINYKFLEEKMGGSRSNMHLIVTLALYCLTFSNHLVVQA